MLHTMIELKHTYAQTYTPNALKVRIHSSSHTRSRLLLNKSRTTTRLVDFGLSRSLERPPKQILHTPFLSLSLSLSFFLYLISSLCFIFSTETSPFLSFFLFLSLSFFLSFFLSFSFCFSLYKNDRNNNNTKNNNNNKNKLQYSI